MKKEFDQWNEKKKLIDGIQKKPFFHEREIWFIRIGENVGYEQGGKGDEFLRPVLICKKFSNHVFLGIPLTSKKKYNKFHVGFKLKNKESFAILSQVRLFDAKRLDFLYGKLNSNDFNDIKNKLIDLIR